MRNPLSQSPFSRCSPLLRLFFSFVLVGTSAWANPSSDGDPVWAKLKKYSRRLSIHLNATTVSKKSAYYRSIEAIYGRVWDALIDVYVEKASVPQAQKDAARKLKGTPPELEIFQTDYRIAEYHQYRSGNEILQGKGIVRISTGKLNEIYHQIDAVAGLLSHEGIHALQVEKLDSAKMRAEEEADTMSVWVLQRAGFNPTVLLHSRAAGELREKHQQFTLQGSTVAENESFQRFFKRMADEHPLSHVRKLKIEETLRLAGAQTPIDFSHRLNPYLEKVGPMPVRLAKLVERLKQKLKALPPGSFFKSKENPKKLTSKILDLFALLDLEEKVPALFRAGKLYFLFEIMEQLLTEQVNSADALAAYFQWMSEFQLALGNEYQGTWASALEQLGPSLLGEGSTERFLPIGDFEKGSYASLSFKDSLLKIYWVAFHRFLEFPEVKKEIHEFLKVTQKTHKMDATSAFFLRLLFVFMIQCKGTFPLEIDHTEKGEFVYGPSSSARLDAIGLFEPKEKGFWVNMDPSVTAVGLEVTSEWWVTSLLQEVVRKEVLVAIKANEAKTIDQWVEIQTYLLTHLVTAPLNPFAAEYALLFLAQLERYGSTAGIEQWASIADTRQRLWLFMPSGLDPKILAVLSQIGEVREKLLQVTAKVLGSRDEVEGHYALENLRSYYDGLSWKNVPRSQTEVDELLQVLEQSRTLIAQYLSGQTKSSRWDTPVVFQYFIRPEISELKWASANQLVSQRGVPVQEARNFHVSQVDSLANTFVTSNQHLFPSIDNRRFIKNLKDTFSRPRNQIAGRLQMDVVAKFSNRQSIVWPKEYEFEFLRTHIESSARGRRADEIQVAVIRGGDLSGIEILAPAENAEKLSEAREINYISNMVFNALIYYSDIVDMRSYRVVESEAVRTDVARLFLGSRFLGAVQKAKHPVDIFEAFRNYLPRWPKLRAYKDASALQALLLDNPDMTENVFFKKSVERAQSLSFRRLKEEFDWEDKTDEEKINSILLLTKHGNGTFTTDRELLAIIEKMSNEEVAQILRKYEVQTFDEILYHPSLRVLVTAHLCRGLKTHREQIALSRKLVPKKEGYLEVWNLLLGLRANEAFKRQPITRELYQRILSNIPVDAAPAKTLSAEEFYARLLHGLDLFIMRISPHTLTELGHYLSTGDEKVLSEASKEQIRTHLGPILGAEKVNYSIEVEMLNLFQAMPADQRLGFLYNLFARHPTCLNSVEYRRLMAETPLFAVEKETAVSDVKEILWQNMSISERAAVTAFVFENKYLKGTLADNDELIVYILESMGVVGRKLGQLLLTHGYFLRPALREKLKKFRDDNFHSDVFTLIEEINEHFQRDLGVAFWDVFTLIDQILGAGSAKTALKSKAVNQKYYVVKAVDPFVQRQVLRNLHLTTQSVEDWIKDESKVSQHKGIVLYLAKRLEEAVRKEIDLSLETQNALKHEFNLKQRGRHGYATAVECAEHWCSPHLNTVEYLTHRGNLNQVPPTRAEADLIIKEVLAQILNDGFVHGDLQNLGNVLVLVDQKPALIDLSLSRPIQQDKALLMIRVMELVSKINDKIKAKKKTDAEINEIKLILKSIAVAIPHSKRSSLDEAIEAAYRSVTSRSKETNMDFVDLVHAIEKEGYLIEDDFLFLFEIVSVLYQVEKMAEPDSKKAIEHLGSLIVDSLSIAQKLKLKTSSTQKLIGNCGLSLMSEANSP